MPVVASKGTLKRFRVGDLPTVYCIQEYISKAEETSLLTEIRSAKTRWTQVTPASMVHLAVYIVC